MRSRIVFVAVCLAACESTPVAPRAQSGPPEPSSNVASRAVASATSAAPVATASAEPSPSATAPVDASGLPGRTIDYAYDANDVNDRSRAYEGRAFVHAAALGAREPLPLIVFLHGLNRELIPHRWMGGGTEGDVRRIVADLIDRHAIAPAVLAGPGSIVPAAVSGPASFPVFDLDRFVELTEAAVSGVARIDRSRIVVTGHSGAGCSASGGLIAAVRAKARPLAVVSIDTCMGAPLAEALGQAPAETNVVVTWQTASWTRGFASFRKVFAREVATHAANAGVLRELDPLPALPRAHDATVSQTFDKWLPRLLPPPR